MLSQSEYECQTFITVAAWLFMVIGAYVALTSFQQLVYWTFFFESGSPPISMSLISAVSLLFGIVALLLGVGMLNRRAKALSRSVALLWTYVTWMVFGWVWRIGEHIMEWVESSGRATEVSGLAAQWEQYELPATIVEIIVSLVIGLALAWFARRLSRPLIKAAYAA